MPNKATILDAFRLDGKIALVTGASAGIGAALAVALAEAGAAVACHGNSRPAQVTADAIRSAGGEAASFFADLSSPAGARTLFDDAVARFGRIDILVNNAGAVIRCDAVDVSFEDWQRILQINLNSVFQLSQLAGRSLIERKAPGKIVNIASVLSFQGGIRVPAYAASKGGMAQLTRALANEWAQHKIQVNAIAPGYIATDNTIALRNDEKRFRQILERIPAGHWGEPRDIAGAVVFLASEASNYVNGSVLTVDGGWLAR